jgi:hypothetical protein
VLPCGTPRRSRRRCMCHLTRTVQCGPRHGSPTAIVSVRQVCSVALNMQTYKPYGYMHSNIVGWRFYMVWGPHHLPFLVFFQTAAEAELYVGLRIHWSRV